MNKNEYVLILCTGKFFLLFPKKYINKNSKYIFSKLCTENYDNNSKIFLYKKDKKEIFFYGFLFKLWNFPKEILKEKKHSYFFKEALFTIYFHNDGISAWYYKKLPDISKNKLILIDRKKMTVGTFISYFAKRSFNEGISQWDMHTKKHFRKRVKLLGKRREVYKSLDNILKKISEMINLLEDDKPVQITKLLPLLKFEDHTNNETLFNFIVYLLDKSLKYIIADKSLANCTQKGKKIKINFFKEGIKLIKQTNNNSCSIDTKEKILKILEDMDMYCFVSKNSNHFIDSDILVLFFSLKYSIERSFFTRKYVYFIASFYCIDYSNRKQILNKKSIERLKDIYKFVKDKQ